MAPAYGYTSGDTWGYWAQSTTAATTIVIQNSWQFWAAATNSTGGAYQYHQPSQAYHQPPRERTPEEVEALRLRVEQLAEEQRLRDEARAASSAKARELLLSIIDDVQRNELEQHGYFHVHTRDGERTYRLGPSTIPMRVKGEDGRRFSYCIHPREGFPADDTVAALKLLLDHSEDEFLRIANATPLR